MFNAAMDPPNFLNLYTLVESSFLFYITGQPVSNRFVGVMLNSVLSCLLPLSDSILTFPMGRYIDPHYYRSVSGSAYVQPENFGPPRGRCPAHKTK